MKFKKNAGSLCVWERATQEGDCVCTKSTSGGREEGPGVQAYMWTFVLHDTCWMQPHERQRSDVTLASTLRADNTICCACLMSHTRGYLIVTPAETHLGYGRGAAFGLQYLLRLLDMIRVHPPDKSYWKCTLCQRSMTSTVCTCSLEKKRAVVVLPFIEHISRINCLISCMVHRFMYKGG